MLRPIKEKNRRATDVRRKGRRASPDFARMRRLPGAHSGVATSHRGTNRRWCSCCRRKARDPSVWGTDRRVEPRAVLLGNRLAMTPRATLGNDAHGLSVAPSRRASQPVRVPGDTGLRSPSNTGVELRGLRQPLPTQTSSAPTLRSAAAQAASSTPPPGSIPQGSLDPEGAHERTLWVMNRRHSYE